MIPRLLFTALLSISISACQATSRYALDQDGPPERYRDVTSIPNATPKREARSRYGNPPSYVVRGKRYAVLPSAKDYKARGIASWYGRKFQSYRTSSGEPYDVYGMTAAHKSLPLPTYVKVRNLDNGREVIVKVNDRGPFHDNRLIDLSYAAAKKLGITAHGTGLVEIEALEGGRSIVNNTPGSTTHKLFLQVGAFSLRANAMRYAKKIANLTQRNVMLTENTSNHHPIYRVKIGPIQSVTETDKVHNQIKDAGFGDALVVIQ